MIILCDTSTSWCLLTLVDDSGKRFEYKWEANRELARFMLEYVRNCLEEHAWTFEDVTGIGVMKGPGSFTGLRIGLTVLNTVADSEKIAIIGESGEGWEQRACQRLIAGENDQIVMPDYGGVANITKPRK